MRNARKLSVRSVRWAASAVVGAAFLGVAAAQEGDSIPTTVGSVPSGTATLGVDAADADVYSGFSGVDAALERTRAASTRQNKQAASSAAVEPTGRPASSAAIDETGRAAVSAAVDEIERAAEIATNPSEETENIEFDDDGASFWAQGPRGWFGPNGLFGRDGISASLKTALTFSIFAIAPAILLATTSFARISVVLMLLRQALGAGQIPSNQTIAALAVFLSILIMTPVWSEVYEDAVVPYSAGQIAADEALERGQAPIRTFLWRQIEKTGNAETIAVFTQFIPGKENPEYYEDVPWRALAPAFLLSELKTAFLIGFQIFIPFLILDVVVSAVLASVGTPMLPPTVVSLPFKLALFALTDGWTLVVKSLLESFAWSGVGG
ncbi:MAG: EscR/YscR/HrcR family type III secretion system export apparatus protein [Thermoguttaceae bacterium]|nr:EscR/YscR/HrcR family type III secretion system export apparatus protein [Thermoguttaceae bacterium]